MTLALMSAHEALTGSSGGGENAATAKASEERRSCIDVDINDHEDVTLSYDMGDVGAECQFNAHTDSPTVIAERLERFARDVREYEVRARDNPPAVVTPIADETVAERSKAVEAASDDEIERELNERRRGEQHVQMEQESRVGGEASDPIQPGPTTDAGPGSRPT
jgi:hypothetical protein